MGVLGSGDGLPIEAVAAESTGEARAKMLPNEMLALGQGSAASGAGLW
jgi:hypothetical protein